MSFESQPVPLFQALAHTQMSHDLGAPSTKLPLLHSRLLMQGSQAVNIVHNDSTYKLQVTKLGKLILTK